jgi:hypothetical protein
MGRPAEVAIRLVGRSKLVGRRDDGLLLFDRDDLEG